MKPTYQAIVFSAILLLTACTQAPSDSAQNTQIDKVSSHGSSQNTDAEPVKSDQRPLSAEELMLSKGKRLYARCQACHTLAQDGKQSVGPNLWGLIGAEAGQKDGFSYSKAMAASGVIWTEEALSAYIENPRQFMPGNRMSFVGLRKPEDREALIAYLKQKTSAQD